MASTAVAPPSRASSTSGAAAAAREPRPGSMASPAVASPSRGSSSADTTAPSPAVASPSRASPTAVASPNRGSPTADTTAPSPASPPRRLASAPPAVDASPASALWDQLSASDAASQLLASRSEEYRLLFRLPPDEVLLQDFNCALQENILLQGHMYLFLHHICFYSNIFGYETKKTIPLQEVTDVRKAKTAAIFPNAIEIIAGSRRHFFGSFLSRDEAYRIIVDGLEQHVRVLLERQDAKSASSTEENGYVLLEGAKVSKQEEDSSTLDRSAVSAAVTSSADSGDSDINIPKRFSKVQEDGLEDNTVELNPFSLGPVDDDAPNVPEPYILITESKFQVSVEVLFNMLFSDAAFGFSDDFHKKCGDKEFSCSKWCLDEQGQLVRNVSFLHPIKIYLGAKFGTCQEVQKLRIYKNRHMVIQTSQSIGDAPYSDYFTVEGIWDVEQDNKDETSCFLRTYLNVAFSKKTIFRGKIEQSTKDECCEVFGLWIKLADELLKQESSSEWKGASSSIKSGLQLEATANGESTLETTVPVVTSTQDESGVRTIIALIQNQHQRTGRDSSIASTSQELWHSLISYMRSSQFGPILAVALVVLVILLQVTIIVLLTRSPQVQMVPHGASVGSFSSTESIAWMQKRISLLREEMQLAEAHMERMRHEFAWLRSHLEKLERLRGSS